MTVFTSIFIKSTPGGCSYLKRGKLSKRSPASMGLLNPLLPLLVRALASRSAAIVSLTLRVLTYLVQLPLPGENPFRPVLIVFSF